MELMLFYRWKKFSLRAKASNFELEDIKEGVIFAHERNVKLMLQLIFILEMKI